VATKNNEAEGVETRPVDPAETSEPNAAPEAPEVDNSVHLKDITGVRYIGTADARSLTTRDLETVGVEARGDLSWDASNGKFVPKEELNADTLHWLAAQPDFRAE
jgi:hypothetical protein